MKLTLTSKEVVVMADIKQWDVEDTQFWESQGKRIANRNLWISIPACAAAFTVWMYWSIITVQMLNVGFPFSHSQLFTLSAIAGLTGATLRIPNSFFIRIAGGPAMDVSGAGLPVRHRRR
jgi:NNP family nitrate/nitrite transporter-like MFS transporter